MVNLTPNKKDIACGLNCRKLLCPSALQYLTPLDISGFKAVQAHKQRLREATSDEKTDYLAMLDTPGYSFKLFPLCSQRCLSG